MTDEIFRSEIAPVLFAALKDGERQLREAAAIALGMSGDSRDVDALAALLGDKDRAVVEAAILGLGMLRAPKAEEALAKILRDEAAQERRHGIAALALGLSGGEAAQKPLFDGLGTGKSDKIESCRMVGGALWAGVRRSRSAGGPVRARRDPDPEGPRQPGEQAAEAPEHGRRRAREDPRSRVRGLRPRDAAGHAVRRPRSGGDRGGPRPPRGGQGRTSRP